MLSEEGLGGWSQVVHTPPQFAADDFALSEGRFDEVLARKLI